VGGVGERAVDELEVAHPAQVGGPHVGGSQVREVLGDAQPLEALLGGGGPSGDLEGEVLERRQGALAAPVVEHVRHQSALPAGAGPERVQEAYSEQVAQVGDHPVGTGLDERVVVQLREVGGDHVALLAEDLQQRLEDPTLAGLDVPLVVDHGSRSVSWSRRRVMTRPP
jgi:hypothetical protein